MRISRSHRESRRRRGPVASLLAVADSTATPIHGGAYRDGLAFGDANLAQWGWQMHQAMSVVQGDTSTYDPDYVLVELGFNDLGWFVSDPDGLWRDLNTFLDGVEAGAEAKGHLVKVLVATVPHRRPITGREDLETNTDTYNARLRANAAPLGGASAGRPDLAVGPADLAASYQYARDSYDGLHPNVVGETTIAGVFANALNNVYGLGGPYTAPGSLPADLHPTSPTSLTVTKTTGYSTHLSWPHVFGAGGYWLWTNDVTKGDGWQKSIFQIGADSWDADNQPSGHTIQYKIQVARGDYESGTDAAPQTSEVGQDSMDLFPAVPNVKVAVSATTPYSVTVSWNAVAGADDYNVFGGPGCDIVTPPTSGYTLLQYNLAGKTSWTDPYVTDPCYNFTVVAVKNGGYGAKPVLGVRAWPYQNNWDWVQANNRFFTDPPLPTDQIARTTVPAQPDRGIVVIRAVIRDTNAFNASIGDQRGWGTQPYDGARVHIAWNTGTGQVAIYAEHSCILGLDAPGGSLKRLCGDALPIAFQADAASIGDSSTLAENVFSVTPIGSTGLQVQMSAVNAWNYLFGQIIFDNDGAPISLPILGRINATINLSQNPSILDDFQASVVGDKYPSYEIIRYPHTVQGAPAGVASVIGDRDQSVVTDLEFGSQSSCISVGAEDPNHITNMMSC